MKVTNAFSLFAAAVLLALAFVFYGIFIEFRKFNVNYHKQEQVKLHPTSREEWMRNSLDSAKLEFDSLLIGDASRELHRERYYNYLVRIDSIMYNDPARYDDVTTDWTNHMDSITAQHKKYGTCSQDSSYASSVQ